MTSWIYFAITMNYFAVQMGDRGDVSSIDDEGMRSIEMRACTTMRVNNPNSNHTSIKILVLILRTIYLDIIFPVIQNTILLQTEDLNYISQ